jgi:NAD+ diphosphatase
MLVTSPCQQFALLGRKSSWPPGRYSTLAGFCEVGETLEDCCRRETFEESGVVVDPSSVTFVASQPWPFPRSLMVGFRATAVAVEPSSNDQSRQTALPSIQVDTSEMQDIQWFAKDFVRQRLEGGSTALTYEPNGKEADFHIPGKASLARALISRWAEEP